MIDVAIRSAVLVSHMRNVQRLISLTSVMGQIIVNPDLRPYIQWFAVVLYICSMRPNDWPF